jgi:hypothetical protein
MRRSAALLTALFALAVAAPAAPAAAAPGPSVPLRAGLQSCTTGEAAADRAAVFTGSMPALRGTRRMWMRFDLLERRPGDGAWTRVAADGLGLWERSRPGRSGFVFSKRVERLAAPAWYRAVVRFRWYDASGRLQRQTTRRTPVCRQPDPRPNVVVSAIDVIAPGRFTVTVANRGRAAAPPFAVLFTVDGDERTDRRRERVLGLEPGQVLTIPIEARPCRDGGVLRAEADPEDVLDESDEDDGALARPC